MAEAVARQIRRELLTAELEQYQREYGASSVEELAQARAELSVDEAGRGADAA